MISFPLIPSGVNQIEQASEKKPKTDDLRRNNFIDVTVKFIGEKWDTFFKTVYMSVDWAKYLDIIPVEHDQLAGNVRRTANIIKLGHGPVELVENVNNFIRSAHRAGKQKTFENIYRAGIDLVGCYSPAFDTVELASKTLVQIPIDTFRTLEGINGTCLVIGMSNQTKDAIEKIANSNLLEAKTEKEKKKAITIISQALLDMAKAVSYVALGCFVVLAIFFNTVAPGFVFLALSTSALVFTIFGYYHKNWGMPIEPKKPDFYWIGAT